MRSILVALFAMIPVVAFAGDLVSDLNKAANKYVPFPPCYVSSGRTPNTLQQTNLSHCGGFHDGYRGDKVFK